MSVSCYLNLEFESGPVKGSCTTAGHKDQIQLVGWSHNFSQQATGAAESAFGGMATSYANHGPLVISKYLDKSSGAILKACWSGAYLKKATIMSYRASGKDSVEQSTCYLKVEAENGIVTDYQINDNADVAMEQFIIKYQQVTYTFTPTDNETGEPGPAEPVSHNLAENTIA